MKNYVIYHIHSDLSNGTTVLDCVNKYQQYVEKAKELGMSAMAFSEHGNIFEWFHKKEAIESVGMKYIHGVEAYVTLGKRERDNWHVGLYAKNYSGVLEINKLLSHECAFNREDGEHFYFSPRIKFQELLNTSDNIIITTACLGGILNLADELTKSEFIEFLKINNHRCFLEIQHHNVKEQIDYNKYLYSLSNQIKVPLITGTDTHALNYDYTIGRSILQARKNTKFSEETDWDLTFKSYDELVECYKLQNSLPMDVILEAIDNTNKFAEMVEEFELDKCFKYPKLYSNPHEKIEEFIKNGYNRRGIEHKENVFEYDERIEYELGVYEKQDAIDFLLLEEDIKTQMAKENIYCGYSRGSVSGSEIAYVLGITDVDSIKYGLYFERFMNPERISLADVDSDWHSDDRDRVKEYIHIDMKQKFDNLYTAEIITFNTIALKGAIRDIAGGIRELSDDFLDSISYPKNEVITLEETNIISKNIESNEEEYRKKYPNLFKYVDMVYGVITSIGSHPAATVVSPIDLATTVGTFTLPTNRYPITQLNMKEIDSLNYVKLDVLGLDNVGIINKACKLANIDRLTPDNMDFNDENVWDNISNNPFGIFQFEGSYAHSLLKKIISKETVDKIREVYPNVSKLSLMSMANGALRPAGESYRDALTNGEFKDNGHKSLNDMLGSTNGFLVYQEQILKFLNEFCGFSLGEADVVRRGFAKKTGTEKFIPKIKDGFIKHMSTKYGMNSEDAEKILLDFIQVIDDASRYLFSLNHSDPYSMIGFATGYLRTYYPLEFLTAIFDINKGDLKKTSSATEYMNTFTNIKLSPAKFRRSKGDYIPNKEENTIYKGIGSIKDLNSQIGDELYELRYVKYNSFLELLDDIDSYCSIASNQLEILIKLDFFSEFGNPKYLLNILSIKDKFSTAKVISKSKYPELENELNKYSGKITEKQFRDIDNFGLINCMILKIDKTDRFTIKELSEFQMNYLGYVALQFDIDKRYHIVKSIDAKYTPKVEVQSLSNGESFIGKINKKIFDKSLKIGDVIFVQRRTEEFAWKKTEGGFERDETRKEWHIKGYSKVADWELEELIYG